MAGFNTQTHLNLPVPERDLRAQKWTIPGDPLRSTPGLLGDGSCGIVFKQTLLCHCSPHCPPRVCAVKKLWNEFPCAGAGVRKARERKIMETLEQLQAIFYLHKEACA